MSYKIEAKVLPIAGGISGHLYLEVFDDCGIRHCAAEKTGKTPQAEVALKYHCHNGILNQAGERLPSRPGKGLQARGKLGRPLSDSSWVEKVLLI